MFGNFITHHHKIALGKHGSDKKSPCFPMTARKKLDSKPKPAPNPFDQRCPSSASGNMSLSLSSLALGSKRWRWIESIDPYRRHKQIMASFEEKSEALKAKTYVDILKENHRFLRTEEDDDGSWDACFAKRYYDRLFKEYVICSLKGYKRGEVGFRWRTKAEVISGRGQFSCGNRTCSDEDNLRSYEVNFEYEENGIGKQALVKVRLCISCAFRLNYKHLKKERRKEKKAKRRKLEVIKIESDESDGEDSIIVDSEDLEHLAELAKPEPTLRKGSDGEFDDLLL